jgi:dihydropyrimidinase
MSLQRFVDITSTNAAKLMGLYPRKGVLGIGSDADITIIDPSIKKKLSLDDLHLADYSVWENWEIAGWPVTTILRGKVMVEDGKLLGKAGDGQLMSRKIGADIVSRPSS